MGSETPTVIARLMTLAMGGKMGIQERAEVYSLAADVEAELTAAQLALQEVREKVDCEYFDGSLTVPEQRDGEWAFTETIVRRFKTEAEARAAHKATFLAAMKR